MYRGNSFSGSFPTLAGTQSLTQNSNSTLHREIMKPITYVAHFRSVLRLPPQKLTFTPDAACCLKVIYTDFRKTGVRKTAEVTLGGHNFIRAWASSPQFLCCWAARNGALSLL